MQLGWGALSGAGHGSAKGPGHERFPCRAAITAYAICLPKEMIFDGVFAPRGAKARRHPASELSCIPFAASIGVLGAKGTWQLNPAGSVLQIQLVPLPDDDQVSLQRWDHGARKQSCPILLTLSTPNQQLPSAEVQILHAQGDALEQA